MRFTSFFIALLTVACAHNMEQAATDTETSEIVSEVSANDPGLEHRKGILHYNNRVFSGYVVEHYSNQTVRARVAFRAGKKHGLSFEWWPDGSLKEQREYHNGLKVSLHKAWHENGQQKFEAQFVLGEYHGYVKEWYEDGSLFRYFNYEHGKEAGHQQAWKEDGRIQANYVVKDGRKYGLTGLMNCKTVGDETES